MRLLSLQTGALIYTLTLMCAVGCQSSSNPQTDRPHIIIILADDMGYGDPGVYNSASKIPTPNIDRIASEGIRLTDAHSPSAVCTPTRYGLLTGRYAWRTRLKNGVLNGYSPDLIDTSRVTVASLLHDNGYATGGVGKWHLGLGRADSTDYFTDLRPGPLDHGFDYYFGIPASLDMAPYVFIDGKSAVETPTAHVDASAHRRQQGGGFWRAGPIAPTFRHIDVLPVLTEKAVDFIEENANAPDPFFLYFALSAPHTPWVPTAQFNGASGAGYYGDFAVQVDWTVGEVLKSLDRLGIADNTLVVFTSDNGSHWYPEDIETFGHSANGILRGQKADIWEGGHRVPFAARWPNHIPAGAVSRQTMTHTDLLATVAELIGVTLPDDAGEDSYSMLSVLQGVEREQPVRPATIHHSVDGMFAIRKGDWKLIEGRGSGGFTQPRRIEPGSGEPAGQLYDLAADPAEEHNLYLERPEIVAELQELLDEIRDAGRSR